MRRIRETAVWFERSELAWPLPLDLTDAELETPPVRRDRRPVGGADPRYPAGRRQTPAPDGSILKANRVSNLG